VKDKKFVFTFDATKKARFGVLPRYAKDDLLIKWFELPNCFIFHNGALLSFPCIFKFQKRHSLS
jgi:carotenoid cleavage dioxygenase